MNRISPQTFPQISRRRSSYLRIYFWKWCLNHVRIFQRNHFTKLTWWFQNQLLGGSIRLAASTLEDNQDVHSEEPKETAQPRRHFFFGFQRRSFLVQTHPIHIKVPTSYNFMLFQYGMIISKRRPNQNNWLVKIAACHLSKSRRSEENFGWWKILLSSTYFWQVRECIRKCHSPRLLRRHQCTRIACPPRLIKKAHLRYPPKDKTERHS